MPGANDNQNTSAEGQKAQLHQQELKTETVGEAMQKEQETPCETRAQQISKEQAEKLYEERMEEEYAKREGGA